MKKRRPWHRLERIVRGLDQDVHRPTALRAAIVDGLTFGGNLMETGTDSYRAMHTQQTAATV